MLNITELQDVVSKKISEYKLKKEPRGLYAPVEYALDSGGKRIRPVLSLAACNIFSEDIKPAFPVALATEVFHNFTLLHDDIMDNSSLRRNKETVHVKWDKNTAILSGDVMLIKAYELLENLLSEKLPEIFSLFNKTAAEVCEGQQFDMDFERKEYVSESEYLEMIRLKTSVLMAFSLKAGAVCGNAPKKDADMLYDFGINIGTAFQLKDDLLDVYAEDKGFGKKTGNDILTGKKTFLLIKAFEKSDETNRKELMKTISDKNITSEEKIKKVKKIYDSVGVKQITEEKIREFHDKALISLEKVGVNEVRKKVLFDFASKLKTRKV